MDYRALVVAALEENRQVLEAVSPGDLLIGHCAVTNVELDVIRLAKAAGARVALLTAHPENEHGQLANLCVRVLGQIFGGPQEMKSIQPMASLLEQALFLFTEIVVTASYREERSIGAVDAGKSYKPGGPSPFIRLTAGGPDHDDISQFPLIIKGGISNPNNNLERSAMPEHRVHPVLLRVIMKKNAREAGLA